MTSITAQQTKLNLELVPKENRLDIGKCSGRIPRGLKLKEKTFQVVLDALAITPCYPTFVITADVPKVYLHHMAVPADEEPIQKGKRVKRSANKSSTTPTTSIVIREPLVETQSKRKEKVDVAHGKGIDLLSEVALTKEAQMKEVRKKSLRDFHKSHPSGFGSVAENPPSVEKITSPVTSKGTGDRPGVPDVTKYESTESESEVIALEKDVAELKNDPLHTQVTSLVDDHLDTRMGVTKEEFMNFLSASLTDRITEQIRNQLPHILPEEVSKFAPPITTKMIQESLNQRSRDHKDKDEGPSVGSDQGLKKRKMSKDAEPTTSSKTKDSSSRSSKSTKSQPKSSGKSVHAEEPEFKTPQKGPTQNWLKTLTASTSTCKSLKELDELMSTPIEFTSYILNGLKIKNMTQEILLGPAFRLLKSTRSNYSKLKYDFGECYKALSKKLDWENPKGDDYPFDLSKPLYLIMRRNRQSVPVELFINNDLKYLQGGTSTMTYTTSTTKTKAAQYDLPGIEDMVYEIGIQSRGDVYSTKCILAVTHISVMRKHRYRLMSFDELYKFSDGTLTRLLSSLKDITQNIDMEYLPKRRWSTLEKKRAHYMTKDINKLLKERRMMRSLEKFVGGRLYGTDLRLLQRTI
nr:hypothetical protein [Tanacetum cinerariifolium]